MKLLKFLFMVSVFGLLLNACSSDVTRPAAVQYIDKNDPTWQQNWQRLQQIGAYAANGQIGYISPQERFSTRFEWLYRTPTAYRLKLYSLLSKLTLTLDMQPRGMVIADNAGNRVASADAAQLVRDMVGVDIPLQLLAFWLKGQPVDGDDYQVGTNHLLAALRHTQNGSEWTADYLAFHDNNLPKNILLKNQITRQTLKIQLDQWLLP